VSMRIQQALSVTKKKRGHVAVGVVSRVCGTSRSLRQHVCSEWLLALRTVKFCSVVNVTGCVEDDKEKPAAE
jgi:hypothetical protein